MGALRKTLVYLGLAEDVYDDEIDPDAEDLEPTRSVRPSAAERSGESARDRRGGATVTPLPHVMGAHGPMQRITAVHPRSYNDAKIIGQHFREGTPVIMNLTDMADADAKRLVDFAAGLVFGLHGAVERVTSRVFLLSPAAIEVTNETQEPAAPTGFFNQS